MIPSNGVSLLNVAVNDIPKYSMEQYEIKSAKVQRNVNFMQNDNFTTRPIVLGKNRVECVTTYKLLGIIITNDFKWNEHIDYVSEKAAKRLYSLRILFSQKQDTLLYCYGCLNQ